MGILASLLPGVRHLRAPLAAGYLWFTVGWIFLHDHVRRASGDGALGAFTALRDELSVAVVGVAVSFAAFIAGALTQPVGMAVPLSLTRMYRVLRDGSTRTIYLPTGYAERHGPLPAELSLRRAKLLLEMEVRFVEDLSGKHVFDVGDWLYKRELRGSTPADAIVRDDLPLIHRRLAGEQKTTELFAEIDRTQSEAELRLAVWLPLAVALVAFAATQWDGVRAWLAVPVAAGVAVGLAVQGVRRLRAANDTLVDNVRLDAGGSANFPTFQHLAVSAQREEERIKREEVADKERRERVAQVDAEQKEASRQRLRDIEADLKEVEGQLEQ